jgi:pimeloyl-ACP methyl ester carboxylesterase
MMSVVVYSDRHDWRGTVRLKLGKANMLMGEFVVRVADAFGLEQPHVVGPDVGTGASLFAAALYQGRFRSLVVGTGGAAVPLRLGGVLKEWVEALSLSQDRRTPDSDRCDCDPRAVHLHGRGPRGLSRVLRRRALRRVDALRAHLPGAAAGLKPCCPRSRRQC